MCVPETHTVSVSYSWKASENSPDKQAYSGGSSEACSRPAEALHIQGFDYEPSLTS